MIRLRLLLLALLPGLLLSSGSSVRVCLHALFGAGEDCGVCSDEVTSCCGAEERADPSAVSERDCASCCIHIEGSQAKLTAKERAACDAPSTVVLAPAAPFVLAAAPVAAPLPRTHFVAHRVRCAPCTRGILPLRI